MRVLQLILALSFLVMIHELGHFCFARIFKVRVEKFYLFFNPWTSLVRMKRFGGKWHFRFFSPNTEPSLVPLTDENGEPVLDKKGREQMRPMTEEELKALPEDDWRRYPESTEWGIGWLPFGGYCNISGMVDETTSAGELLSQPQPWEYRSKKTWQRLPIIIGGVLVNFVAAMIIYCAIMFHWGETYLPLENTTYGLQFSEVLQEQGLQNGDKIIKIGEREPRDLTEVIDLLLVGGEREVIIQRGETIDTIALSADFDQILLGYYNGLSKEEKANAAPLIDARFPFVVDSVQKNMPAADCNMQKGDRVIAINGVATEYYQDVRAELLKHPCEQITIDFLRGNDTLTVSTLIGDKAQIGVFVVPMDKYLTFNKIEYSFLESIPAGIRLGWNTLTGYVKQFKIIFTKEGVQQLGGFGTMGKMFPEFWDWHRFWTMTAFLSIILAFMNIIPIPGLDGGYVLFLLWEMITGKKPSDKFLTIANNIGFAFLIILLIYANGMDIFRLFK